MSAEVPSSDDFTIHHDDSGESYVSCPLPGCVLTGILYLDSGSPTLGKIRRVVNAHIDKHHARCTPFSAFWCPIHGDCKCADPLRAMDDSDCPLHSPSSLHDVDRESGGWDSR